jgi:hypothetical protein
MSKYGKDQMIVTTASAAFGPSLLALFGSMDCNWPGHPLEGFRNGGSPAAGRAI